jgi:hypothetical protein
LRPKRWQDICPEQRAQKDERQAENAPASKDLKAVGEKLRHMPLVVWCTTDGAETATVVDHIDSGVFSHPTTSIATVLFYALILVALSTTASRRRSVSFILASQSVSAIFFLVAVKVVFTKYNV